MRSQLVSIFHSDIECINSVKPAQFTNACHEVIQVTGTAFSSRVASESGNDAADGTANHSASGSTDNRDNATNSSASQGAATDTHSEVASACAVTASAAEASREKAQASNTGCGSARVTSCESHSTTAHAARTTTATATHHHAGHKQGTSREATASASDARHAAQDRSENAKNAANRTQNRRQADHNNVLQRSRNLLKRRNQIGSGLVEHVSEAVNERKHTLTAARTAKESLEQVADRIAKSMEGVSVVSKGCVEVSQHTITGHAVEHSAEHVHQDFSTVLKRTKALTHTEEEHLDRLGHGTEALHLALERGHDLVGKAGDAISHLLETSSHTATVTENQLRELVDRRDKLHGEGTHGAAHSDDRLTDRSEKAQTDLSERVNDSHELGLKGTDDGAAEKVNLTACRL